MQWWDSTADKFEAKFKIKVENLIHSVLINNICACAYIKLKLKNCPARNYYNIYFLCAKLVIYFILINLQCKTEMCTNLTLVWSRGDNWITLRLLFLNQFRKIFLLGCLIYLVQLLLVGNLVPPLDLPRINYASRIGLTQRIESKNDYE